MIEIMKVQGSNTYKIPHMNKIFLEMKRKLHLQMQCDAQLIEKITDWLNTHQDV